MTQKCELIETEKIIQFIKSKFPNKEFIPLHSPHFGGNERKYINETIDSTFVSSVGEFVNLFERKLVEFTSCKYAIATVNGTSALHIALLLCNVTNNDEVISQAITFIATANAISYVGATPIFIDSDIDTMGMSPKALNLFLNKNAEKKADGFTYNKNTGRKISACIPMHTFGLPLRIDEITDICLKWNISLVEDAAESIGSYYNGRHTGTFGKIGVFSFNGNKTITCGGGGAIITDDKDLAIKAKHITTQAKVPHPWRFTHDQIAYNYRMPNLNAALACAQLEQLPKFLQNKRELSSQYETFFKSLGIPFAKEINNAKSNYWLNAIILSDRTELDNFLLQTNREKVMTRPMWDLMNTLPMFGNCQHDDLINSRWLQDRVVNIPSSVEM